MKLQMFDKLCAHIRASDCFILRCFSPWKEGCSVTWQESVSAWRSGGGRGAVPRLLGTVLSLRLLFAHTSHCFPAGLVSSRLSSWKTWAASSPWAKTRKTKTNNAGLWEEGRKLASASCSIDLCCFYRFFSKTTIPETSFSPSYHQAALLFFFLPFFFF